MLPKEQRLSLRDSHIQERLRYGKRLSSPLLKLVFFIEPNSPSQAAVIVSKKVAKSAVIRNRVRRVLYAELAQSAHFDQRGIKVLVVVRANPDSKQELLRTTLRDLLKKI